MITQSSQFKDIVRSYSSEAIDLLSDLISIPSLSQEEDQTADLISLFFQKREITCQRHLNNIWCQNREFDSQKPTILLNSHHDTVKPNNGYTRDPFKAEISHGKLFGLGSNDAGGCLVSLLFTFLHFYNEKELPYNLIFAATAEEENSGQGGVESILANLNSITFGIVGEPTEMKMAVAEKGLLVLDCYSRGESGHAARDQGVNAIYNALGDMDWFRTYQFPKTSQYLGPVKMTVTMIDSGYQHNVIPDECHFVVDVRTTDAYSNLEVLDIIKENVSCEVRPRSVRLNPSYLPEDIPIFRVAQQMQIEMYGSPTTSDQAVMSFPTLKMGPGKSERSHTPDEFIFVDEIYDGIQGYINLLENLFAYQTQNRTS